MVAKRNQGSGVHGNRMVGVIARDDGLEPHPLLSYAGVHSLAQLRFDFQQFSFHPVCACFAQQYEFSFAGFAANEGKAQKREGLWLCLPTPLAPERCIAAKFKQAGLVPMQFESEFLEPLSHRVPEALGICLQLKACHDVIGITHKDDLAFGLSLSPLLRPQVKDLVQVHVGQQGRYDCALRGSHVTALPLPFFQYARLEPLAHQADDALVTDSVL